MRTSVLSTSVRRRCLAVAVTFVAFSGELVSSPPSLQAATVERPGLVYEGQPAPTGEVARGAHGWGG